MNESDRKGAAAVLVSGGLDSAILCAEMLGERDRVWPIYVRFGLRWEEAELAGLQRFLDAVGSSRPGLAPLTVLDEPVRQVYGDHWSNPGRPGVPGAGTDDSAVYLPGRNVLLGAKAAVWCRVRGVDALAFGILEGNPFPDGTPGFFREFESVLNRAMDGRLRITRPYEGRRKADVLKRGEALGLPLELTFSCIQPRGGRHCGRCNKCGERREAFREAGVDDRTGYAGPAPHSSSETSEHDPTCSE